MKAFAIPKFQPDIRKTNCYFCTQKFGLSRREHQCKRCLRAVCDECSPAKGTVF